MDRFEALIGQNVRDAVVVKRSYAMTDFEKDYHSFKGNAYGLANTLFQTAFFKPKLKSKKVNNLYYTGQLTVPGPGVPPSLISGQVVAQEIVKDYGG
jgi:phytoene desaturase